MRVHLIPVENYTDSTFELVERACSGLKKIYKPGYGYKKAGVIITSISRKADITPPLFYERDRSKESSVMTVMDEMKYPLWQAYCFYRSRRG